MADLEDDFTPKIFSLTTTVNKKNRDSDCDKHNTGLCVSSFPFFNFLLIIFGCFWRIHLPRICDPSTVWIGVLCSAAVYFLFSRKQYEKAIFYRKTRLKIIGQSFRDPNPETSLPLAEAGFFHQIFK